MREANKDPFVSIYYDGNRGKVKKQVGNREETMFCPFTGGGCTPICAAFVDTYHPQDPNKDRVRLKCFAGHAFPIGHSDFAPERPDPVVVEKEEEENDG